MTCLPAPGDRGPARRPEPRTPTIHRVSVLAIVLIVAAVLVLALFAGGVLGAARRARSTEGALRASLERANEELALAHAQDKGWDRATMESAAREAHAAAAGGASIQELHLVQVVDLPGTDADEAVFRVVAAGGESQVKLGRRDGVWVARS